MRLSWETSSNGLNAIHLERKRIQTPNPLGVASQKAWDVDWIRAAFGSEWTGFEPYLRLWVTEGKNARGLTILMHNYPKDEELSILPNVCVRWMEWNGETAIQDFIVAENKQCYIRDDLPLQCVLRFYHREQISIDRLMDRTGAALAGGVPFIKADRPELNRRHIEIEFCDGMLFYQFHFSPSVFSNLHLEQVIQEWIDYARALQAQPDYPPNEGFQIAYRESLWERIARYDEKKRCQEP